MVLIMVIGGEYLRHGFKLKLQFVQIIIAAHLFKELTVSFSHHEQSELFAQNELL